MKSLLTAAVEAVSMIIITLRVCNDAGPVHKKSDISTTVFTVCLLILILMFRNYFRFSPKKRFVLENYWGTESGSALLISR